MGDFNKLFDKLDLMERQIMETNKEVQEIKKSVYKMDNHIDFVESVYNTIKIPFHYTFRLINKTIPQNSRIEDSSINQAKNKDPMS